MSYRKYRLFATSFVEITTESTHEWQKSVFTVMHALFYVSQVPDRTNKPSSVLHLAIFANDGLFWLGIVTASQFNLWRHANARRWYSDVVFVDCSCMLKLAQRFRHSWKSSLNHLTRDPKSLSTVTHASRFIYFVTNIMNVHWPGEITSQNNCSHGNV